MGGYLKGAAILVVLMPFIFLIEAFTYGGPRTIETNVADIKKSCLAAGLPEKRCGCITDEFAKKLDSIDIALRRATFRDTIPDKQKYFDEAQQTCRLQID